MGVHEITRTYLQFTTENSAHVNAEHKNSNHNAGY